MSTTLEAIRNSVDTEQLFATLDAIKASTLARFQFRARNRWIDGAHNRYLESVGLRGVSG
jgi:hypothetical protein